MVDVTAQDCSARLRQTFYSFKRGQKIHFQKSNQKELHRHGAQSYPEQNEKIGNSLKKSLVVKKAQKEG